MSNGDPEQHLKCHSEGRRRGGCSVRPAETDESPPSSPAGREINRCAPPQNEKAEETEGNPHEWQRRSLSGEDAKEHADCNGADPGRGPREEGRRLPPGSARDPPGGESDEEGPGCRRDASQTLALGVFESTDDDEGEDAQDVEQQEWDRAPLRASLHGRHFVRTDCSLSHGNMSRRLAPGVCDVAAACSPWWRIDEYVPTKEDMS